MAAENQRLVSELLSIPIQNILFIHYSPKLSQIVSRRFNEIKFKCSAINFLHESYIARDDKVCSCSAFAKFMNVLHIRNKSCCVLTHAGWGCLVNNHLDCILFHSFVIWKLRSRYTLQFSTPANLHQHPCQQVQNVIDVAKSLYSCVIPEISSQASDYHNDTEPDACVTKIQPEIYPCSIFFRFAIRLGFLFKIIQREILLT